MEIGQITAALRGLGPLRLMLGTLAVLLAVMALEPGSQSNYSGWQLITTTVIPACAPIVFMVLLLDVLMARVWLSDTAGPQRNRFRTVITVDLVLAGVMLLAWLPFFVALGR
ncbi:MAG: hypothetical protein ACR2RB_10840 [Gammaproteobacteria bacterium]